MLIAMHKLGHRKIPGWIQSFLVPTRASKKKKKVKLFFTKSTEVKTII